MPALLCAGLLLAAAAYAQPDDAGGNASSGRNVVGLLSQLMSRPLGFEDPYSWMVGAGAFFERRLGAGAHVVLGARFSVCGQHALEPLYERSTTIFAGPYIGWEVLRRSRGDIELSIVPYAGALQYWRQFEFDSEEYRASRGVLVLGVNIDVQMGARVVCGIASEPSLILDRTPLVAVGQIQRLALRFE